MVILTLGVCRSAASTTATSLKVNPAIIHFATRQPNTKARVRLNSYYGGFLQIASDGTVNGTDTCASKYGKVLFIKKIILRDLQF